MEQNSRKLLLRDKATEPTNSVLEDALGSMIFEVYQQLLFQLLKPISLRRHGGSTTTEKPGCASSPTEKNDLLVVCLPADVSAAFRV